MKLRLVIRIAVIVSIVLLCAGFGVYSFLRLNTVEHQRDFNLYTLVPQDAALVLETDRVSELVEDINGMRCSQDNHFLYISELFVYLKTNLHVLEGGAPHGLSKQMSKMLLSFHEPDDPWNQVLYCSLGAGDYELVEAFVHRYGAGTYPVKEFEYKDEVIRIYPVENGRFLAAYITSDFFAISFQKRLIEQVIDARRSKKSLMEVPSFVKAHTDNRNNVMAMLYARTRMGNWAEFDMKLDEDAIYCYGVVPGDDSIRTFVDTVRYQPPVNDTLMDERWAGSLTPHSDFTMIADMEEVVKQPETYARMIPHFFFRQANFFRHFKIGVQFTCAEEMVYSNIVLLYKD